MFIIFGFGKRTRKVVGVVGSRTCNYCNTYAEWQLCILRTWFTLFFIPIIPYGKSYNIVSPLSRHDFQNLNVPNTLVQIIA